MTNSKSILKAAAVKKVMRKKEAAWSLAKRRNQTLLQPNWYLNENPRQNLI